jgi:predicted Zn-dependent protease with MMP-like domain
MALFHRWYNNKATPYHIPMTPADFEFIVTKIGFSSVPEKFRGLISNVALIIEDDVPMETRRSMNLPNNETLLGLYHGIPLPKRGGQYGSVLPDTITIYRIPIIRAAAGEGFSVQKVIEDTIWHEVAHHFGLNERQVRKREGEIRKLRSQA